MTYILMSSANMFFCGSNGRYPWTRNPEEARHYRTRREIDAVRRDLAGFTARGIDSYRVIHEKWLGEDGGFAHADVTDEEA